MSASLIQPAIQPVIDYEPPAFGGPPARPDVTASRARCAVSARAVGPAGMVGAVGTVGRDADHSRARAAAIFADAVLRRVLEVIDRRRPSAQLRPLLAAGLIDSLPAGAGAAGPARLRRVIAQLAEPGGTAAEVSATFTRGTRLHAIACRVEQAPGPGGPHWQLVALHLG